MPGEMPNMAAQASLTCRIRPSSTRRHDHRHRRRGEHLLERFLACGQLLGKGARRLRRMPFEPLEAVRARDDHGKAAVQRDQGDAQGRARRHRWQPAPRSRSAASRLSPTPPAIVHAIRHRHAEIEDHRQQQHDEQREFAVRRDQDRDATARSCADPPGHDLPHRLRRAAAAEQRRGRAARRAPPPSAPGSRSRSGWCPRSASR